MPFCASCGTQVDGKFCPKCGAPMLAAAQPPTVGPYAAPPTQPPYAPPAPGPYTPPPPQPTWAPPQQQSSWTAPPQQGGYPPPEQQGGWTQPPVSAAPLADNVACTLTYALWFVTGIVFLVMEPYNRNRAVKFHAFQSIFASVVLVLVSIVLGIVFPWGYGFGYSVHRLVDLAYLVFWIYMMAMTYTGKTIVLPFIGPLAQKQAQS